MVERGKKGNIQLASRATVKIRRYNRPTAAIVKIWIVHTADSRWGSNPSRDQTFSLLLDGPLVDRYDFTAVNTNIMEQKTTMATCGEDPKAPRGDISKLRNRWV